MIILMSFAWTIGGVIIGYTGSSVIRVRDDKT
jgi:hypothetical protein